MDSAYEEYKRKQRFVERECHLPGHRFLRLREQGDYEHLACSAIWMMAPERWRQGRLLEQTYHVARFKRALGRNPSKSPCRQYLDALCDFVSAEDGQPDDRAFGSLIRAASDVWGYGSRSKASMHLPDVRAHVTHWLFLMDPYNNIYLKTNKQWESIRAESDGSLDEPFTAAVYDSILRDARAALALFRKHGAKDLLDLQTMLFLLNQEDERFPPGQA